MEKFRCCRQCRKTQAWVWFGCRNAPSHTVVSRSDRDAMLWCKLSYVSISWTSFLGVQATFKCYVNRSPKFKNKKVNIDSYETWPRVSRVTVLCWTSSFITTSLMCGLCRSLNYITWASGWKPRSQSSPMCRVRTAWIKTLGLLQTPRA